MIQCALAREFMLPLRNLARADPDPLIALFAAMETLHANEAAVFQVLLA